MKQLEADVADLEQRYSSLLASQRRQWGRMKKTPLEDEDPRPWKERARSVIAANVAAKRPAAVGVPKE